MDFRKTLRALFGDAPYFSGNTFGIQSNPVRHMMMLSAISLIAKPDQPLKIMEVGSWVGSSALTFAQGIEAFAPMGGTIHCIDIWEPYASATDKAKADVYTAMDALTEDDLAYQLFLHNVSCVKGGISVTHDRGSSADILPTLPDGSFDLVYLDGSHYRDDIARDLLEAKRLVRDGGLLTGDDLECQVAEIDLDFAQQHLDEDFCTDPKTGRDYHPGVTLAVYDFFGHTIPTHHGFWTTRKVGGGFEDFTLMGGKSFIPRHFPEGPRAQCQQLIQQMAAVAQSQARGQQ